MEKKRWISLNVFVIIIPITNNNIGKIDKNNNLKTLVCQEFHSDINPNTC